jgi:hypothetical protein
MHEDYDVRRQTRQKDTLSAEDLGILLQWHWKYGTAAFTNERQRVQLSLLMLLRERPIVRPLPAKPYPLRASPLGDAHCSPCPLSLIPYGPVPAGNAYCSPIT